MERKAKDMFPDGSIDFLIQQAGVALARNARGQFVGSLPLLISSVLSQSDNDQSTHEGLINEILNGNYESAELLLQSDLQKPSVAATLAESVDFESLQPLRRSERLSKPSSDDLFQDPDELDIPNLVYKFYLINLLLPKPWTMVPQSAISDSYVIFTEASVLELLNPVLLKEATGIKKQSSSKGDNERSWLKYGTHTGLNQPQGHFIDFIFGKQLAHKKIKYRTADNQDESKKLILATSFSTDGLQLHLNFYHVDKQPKKNSPRSSKSIMEQAKAFTKKKKPVSDVLTEENKQKVKTVIGADLGETFAGGFCCKDIASYLTLENKGIDTSMGEDSQREDNTDEESEEKKDSRRLVYKKGTDLVNLSIKTSALSEPSRKHRNWLNHQKGVFKIGDMVYILVFTVGYLCKRKIFGET